MANPRTRLNVEGLHLILDRVNSFAQSAVITTAITIRDEAKENAPVDTSALKESIHITTVKDSDYNVAMASAREKFEQAKAVGRTPKGVIIGKNAQFLGLPEIRPTNPTEAWVVVGMSYAVDNEFGNVRQGPNAFLRPAVLNNLTTLTENIRMSFNGLSVKGKYSVTPKAKKL